VERPRNCFLNPFPQHRSRPPLLSVWRFVQPSPQDLPFLAGATIILPTAFLPVLFNSIRDDLPASLVPSRLPVTASRCRSTFNIPLLRPWHSGFSVITRYTLPCSCVHASPTSKMHNSAYQDVQLPSSPSLVPDLAYADFFCVCLPRGRSVAPGEDEV